MEMINRLKELLALPHETEWAYLFEATEQRGI
jgi:hypothetical protein